MVGQGNRMKESGSSFRQGMPESSAMEGNLSVVRLHDLSIAVDHDLPSMHDGPSASSGQDFGIPRHSLTGAGSAKMTAIMFGHKALENPSALTLAPLPLFLQTKQPVNLIALQAS